jgi:hypothetical protein
MNKILKMIGAAGLMGMTLVFAGCGGGGDDGGTAVVPGNQVVSVSLDDKGTPTVAETVSAVGSNNFGDSASKSNNVVITGFGSDDQIIITGATSAQYDTAIQSTATGDVIITYNNGTTTSVITLPGVIPAPVGSKFVSNVADFNALAVGNLVFQ